MTLGNNVRGLILGLIGGVAWLGVAQASVLSAQSTGSITGLTYRLEDLTPNDRITPSISVSGKLQLSNLQAGGGISQTANPFPTANQSFHGASVTPTSWSSQTSAGTLPLPQRDQWRPNREVIAFGDSDGVFYAGSDPYSDFSHWNQITLSPNTRLVIEGVAHLSSASNASVALSSQDIATLDALGEPYEYRVLSQTSIKASLAALNTEFAYRELGSSWSANTSALDGWGNTTTGTLSGQGNSESLDKPFLLTFTNPYSSPINIYLSVALETSVSGRLFTSAVPEPGTCMLMALGLGLIGWRRITHHASPPLVG